MRSRQYLLLRYWVHGRSTAQHVLTTHASYFSQFPSFTYIFSLSSDDFLEYQSGWALHYIACCCSHSSCCSWFKSKFVTKWTRVLQHLFNITIHHKIYYTLIFIELFYGFIALIAWTTFFLFRDTFSTNKSSTGRKSIVIIAHRYFLPEFALVEHISLFWRTILWNVCFFNTLPHWLHCYQSTETKR